MRSKGLLPFFDCAYQVHVCYIELKPSLCKLDKHCLLYALVPFIHGTY
uniref:Aspartate aminotransferase cytoplasmic isoform X2 n=1 Tax=Rhizophora mucronata TaxID=61149 RepID=A0A2P2LKR6_RHIMU